MIPGKKVNGQNNLFIKQLSCVMLILILQRQAVHFLNINSVSWIVCPLSFADWADLSSHGKEVENLKRKSVTGSWWKVQG